MDKLSFSYLLGFVILLGGCSSNPKPIYGSLHSSNLPTQIFLDLSQFNKSKVAMNSPGYDGEAIIDSFDDFKERASMSIEQSIRNYPYPMPAGTDYAVDGALTALGFAVIPIMRSIGEKRAQSRKNEPVKVLLARMESINWESVTELINENIGVPVSSSLSNLNRANGSILRIHPYLEVTSNYQSFELHALVIVNSAMNDVIHHNYYHVQSSPLLEKGILNDLNSISEEQIKVTVSDLFKKMLPLIYADLNEREIRPIRSIRFKNHMGRFYEMGKLLNKNKEEGYISFRTLRGEVKSYPFLKRQLSN